MIEDLDRPGEVSWGFLNTCLKGDAKDTFKAADELDGFSGWRLVTLSIRKSAHSRYY